MTSRTNAAILLLLLAGPAACSDSSYPAAPAATAPTPITSVPALPAGSEAISGTVSDSALRPLIGARVELLDGPQAGTSTTTDARGQFSLVGTVDDTTRFRASKEGHVTADATIQPYCDRCNPKRWVHFYLNVLDAPVAIAGEYTLTFIANSACTNLPAELRTRSYEVTIGLNDFTWIGSPANADTAFKVTPKGLAFPESLNQFWLNVAGNYVAVSLGDHTDPGITERIDEHTYLHSAGGQRSGRTASVHDLRRPSRVGSTTA